MSLKKVLFFNQLLFVYFFFSVLVISVFTACCLNNYVCSLCYYMRMLMSKRQILPGYKRERIQDLCCCSQVPSVIHIISLCAGPVKFPTSSSSIVITCPSTHAITPRSRVALARLHPHESGGVGGLDPEGCLYGVET